MNLGWGSGQSGHPQATAGKLVVMSGQRYVCATRVCAPPSGRHDPNPGHSGGQATDSRAGLDRSHAGPPRCSGRHPPKHS